MTEPTPGLPPASGQTSPPGVTNTLPPPSPAPNRDSTGKFAANPQKSVNHGGALSEAQISSARAKLMAAGMPAERIDAALSASDGLPRVPVQRSDDTARVSHAGASNDPIGLSEAQALSMARALDKAGVPAEKITAAMKADGFEEVEPVNSEAQVKHNADWGMLNVPKASDYRINLAEAGIHGMDPTEAGKFVSDAQEFLRQTGIPPRIGEALITQAIKDTERLKLMTPAHRQLWANEQKYQAQRQAGGAEGLQQRMAAAAAVLKMPGPSEFREQLISSGALNSAFALATLANWGLHIARWQASYPAGKSAA